MRLCNKPAFHRKESTEHKRCMVYLSSCTNDGVMSETNYGNKSFKIKLFVGMLSAFWVYALKW